MILQFLACGKYALFFVENNTWIIYSFFSICCMDSEIYMKLIILNNIYLADGQSPPIVCRFEQHFREDDYCFAASNSILEYALKCPSFISAHPVICKLLISQEISFQ